MVPDPGFITRNGAITIYYISVNITAVTLMALKNRFLGCREYDVEWLVVRSKFQVFLVPNYCPFRITVIYVMDNPTIYKGILILALGD